MFKKLKQAIKNVEKVLGLVMEMKDKIRAIFGTLDSIQTSVSNIKFESEHEKELRRFKNYISPFKDKLVKITDGNTSVMGTIKTTGITSTSFYMNDIEYNTSHKRVLIVKTVGGDERVIAFTGQTIISLDLDTP